jgi:hypothetical protein
MVVDATDNSPVAGATISDFYGRVLAHTKLEDAKCLFLKIVKRIG